MGYGRLRGSESMKTKPWPVIGLLLGLAQGAVGCQQVDSANVRTPGIYAEFIVTEHSTTEANVDATLWVGGALSNTYLRLTGPDRLTTYVGSDAYPMQGYSDIDEHYSAIIPYPATDTVMRVAFERGPDDVSAPDSTVTVPGSSRWPRRPASSTRAPTTRSKSTGRRSIRASSSRGWSTERAWWRSARTARWMPVGS
jgi:hypothetical protein